MRTDNLRRQHDAALAVAAGLREAIAAAGDHPSGDAASGLSILIARLTGALRIHFAQEDKVLYPSLMASGRGGVAAVARRFYEEMGQIGPAVAAYGERWRTSAAIQQRWAAFCGETDAILGALAGRIVRENEELYPLADAEGGASGVQAAAPRSA